VSNVTLKIDGKEVQAERGRTILQVAREMGIEIPTLCYNEKISTTTSCFVCVVKDKKTGKFLPSCAAQAADGMDVDASSEEVRNMRKTALNLLLSEHCGDCEAPCTVACPAQANIEEYVRCGREGKFLESLKIIKERIPLPMSIGRVCPRFCEKDCRRNVTDQPVAINDFKRTAADLHYDEYMEERKPLTGKKVAIVGAGPAGLSAAFFLRLEGVASDLFDMMPKPGGMLRYGIPEYRLPKATLDREIAHFEKMGGINIHSNQKLGEDFTIEELKEKYDAVVVTIGSWRSSSARIEGEEHTIGGIHFLEELARKEWQAGKNPGRTIVIGGGNTAMDCLRTSVRLGSDDVNCFYRRTEKEMPAERIEIDEAKEEGVEFHFLTSPIKLREENGKKIMTCLKMRLGEPDASGRRRPVPIEGSEYDVEADTIIAAIGQKTIAPEGLKTNRWGDVDVNETDYCMEPGVFAAGDCVSGPATVVEAVAAARRAALAVLAYFEGETYQAPYSINVSRGHWNHLAKDDLVYVGDPAEHGRRSQRLIPIEERCTTFNEVAHTFTKEEILEEGKRCFECSCTDKHTCRLKEYSELYEAHPEAIPGERRAHDYDTRHSDVIMDPNKCIKCGTCVKLSREVINSSILGFKYRGFDTVLSTAFGRPISSPKDELELYIENCPTGALAWRKKDD
jgi:formate dehydrogenase major subunit